MSTHPELAAGPPRPVTYAPWRRVRAPSRLLVAELAVVSIGLAIYGIGGARNAAALNQDVTRADQSAYLGFAKRVHARPFQLVSDRSRMPLYPHLLATIYRSGMSDEVFFERAKRFNILLGGALLLGLYFFLRMSLPLLARLVLWSVTALTVFMFKAAYVQAELLFYALFFVGFVLLVEVLRRPTWRRCAVAGFVLGLAYLSKGGVPPVLDLFLAFLALSVAAGAFRRMADDRPYVRWAVGRLGRGAVVLATFLATLYPHVRTNKATFGQYFYSLPSTYYMWYDTWEEASADKGTWQSMPPDAVASPEKYLKDHTAWEVLRRPWYGLVRTAREAADSYGYLKYILLYALLVAGSLLVRPAQAAKAFREQPFVLLFVLSTIGSYLVLYAWYSQITYANRLILVLFLPAMWSLFRLLEHERLRGRLVSIGGRTVPWTTLAHGVVGLVLVGDVVTSLWWRVATMYGGS